MRRVPVKFAPVAPLALMNEMLDKGREVIGNYHLLLAHDVLANEDGWSLWAEELRASFASVFGESPTIIMDNSVIELGTPAPMEDIVRAAKIVDADVVVFPDVIGDAKATQQLITSFIAQLDSLDSVDYFDAQNWEYMFVPQGTCLTEYIESMEFAVSTGIISWLGLPRDALKHGCSSRTQLIDAASLVAPHMKIHLLGFSDDLVDDFKSVHYHPNVVGIDSAVPVRAGQNGIEFRLSQSDYGKRGNYWEHSTLSNLAIANIARTRDLLR